MEGSGAVEQPLVGEGVTQGIVRVGDTVRRPWRPFTATVQSYLAHLRAQGFTGAPEALGADEQGREVVSFVPGWVPNEPLPAQVRGVEVLEQLGALMRSLHEAARSWRVPADAVWGAIPGARTRGVQDLDGPAELVGHRDYCPGNVVFRDGVPAALIDFDLARPTTRAYELANAAFYWVPLWDPVDRPAGWEGLDAGERLRALARGYGAGAGLRGQVVQTATMMVARFGVNMAEAARRDAAFARMVRGGVLERNARAEAWLRAQGPRLRAALVG